MIYVYVCACECVEQQKIQSRSLHGILLFQQSPLVEMKGWTSARKLRKGRSAHKIPPLRGVENCSYETKSINRASPCFKHQRPARKRLWKCLWSSAQKLWSGRDGVTTAYVQCVECTKKLAVWYMFDNIKVINIRPRKSRRKKKPHRSWHVPNGSSIWLTYPICKPSCHYSLRPERFLIPPERFHLCLGAC